MPKAEFGARAFAWIADIIVMMAIASVISLIFGPLIGLTGGRESSFLGLISTTLAILWFVTLALLQFLYFGYFWSKDGRSVGMRWANIRVVRRSKGDEISFLRAGLRGSVGYWLSSVIFYLGYLWSLWDKDKETWHDKAFDTWVVKTE